MMKIELFIEKLITRRRLLNNRIEMFDEAVDSLTDDLLSGEINLQDWVRSMREEMKSLHISAAVIGNGGEVAAMTQADWGWVGAKLRWQYNFLDKLALTIYSQGVPSNLVRRLQMYGDAAMNTLEHFIGQEQGYPPLPYTPGDGSTRCLTSCKCHWKVTTVRDRAGKILGWYVSWIMSDAEHCEDCKRRAEEWSDTFIEA